VELEHVSSLRLCDSIISVIDELCLRLLRICAWRARWNFAGHLDFVNLTLLGTREIIARPLHTHSVHLRQVVIVFVVLNLGARDFLEDNGELLLRILCSDGTIEEVFIILTVDKRNLEIKGLDVEAAKLKDETFFRHRGTSCGWQDIVLSKLVGSRTVTNPVMAWVSLLVALDLVS
jgi:hypothetical protein